MFLSAMPHPALRPFIQHYWAFVSDQPQLVPARIVPDGCIELIVNTGRPYIKNEASSAQPTAFIAGQISKFISLTATGPTSAFGVHFWPHGLAHFTGLPVSEFNDVDVDLEWVWADAGQLVQQMLAAEDFDARVVVMDRFLMGFASLEKQGDQRILAAVLRLSCSGVQSTAHLAEWVNLSSRQLERRFLAEVGIPPKKLARILRFNRAVKQLVAAPQGRLTDLAYELGYTDQAHFNREFKALAGISPKSYLKEQVSESLLLSNISH